MISQFTSLLTSPLHKLSTNEDRTSSIQWPAFNQECQSHSGQAELQLAEPNRPVVASFTSLHASKRDPWKTTDIAGHPVCKQHTILWVFNVNSVSDASAWKSSPLLRLLSRQNMDNIRNSWCNTATNSFGLSGYLSLNLSFSSRTCECEFNLLNQTPRWEWDSLPDYTILLLKTFMQVLMSHLHLP